MGGWFFLFMDSDVVFWITKVDVCFFWESECESEVRVLVWGFPFCFLYDVNSGFLFGCVFGIFFFFFLFSFFFFLALCIHSMDFFVEFF